MPLVTGPIKPFNTIGKVEAMAAMTAVMNGPLSGYLAGKERGGRNVCALEDAWCEMFGVKHAVACNSATSGLLAACAKENVGPGSRVITTPFTMSATAAAPRSCGADIEFVDIYEDTFDLQLPKDWSLARAVIVTNLFGHPARLAQLRSLCDEKGVSLIEDNAQSPFATEHGKYAATIGRAGIFSLNIHKPIQSGEGGIIVTDDDGLAHRLRNFINHGENTGDWWVGMNLRMPEVCAAIALTQLRRGKQIVAERVEQAEATIAAIGDIPGLRLPVVREGCTHVYYTIPFLVEKNRTEFCAALRDEGVPIEEGYVDPLYRMPAFSQFARPCPVAEDLQDRRLMYFENCAWSPTSAQIRQIGDAFKRAAERWLIDR